MVEWYLEPQIVNAAGALCHWGGVASRAFQGTELGEIHIEKQEFIKIALGSSSLSLMVNFLSHTIYT